METLFMFCAVLGGSILVLQIILLLLGGDVDTDVDLASDFDGELHVAADVDGDIDAGDVHGATAALKFLTVKTIVAFVTFFGLVGLGSIKSDVEPTMALLLATGAGFVSLYIVAWLMGLIQKLDSSGNMNLRNAVGQAGKVYLKIPGELNGAGKVTITVQNRSVECRAVTSGAELPTGAAIRVKRLRGADTVEVVSLNKE